MRYIIEEGKITLKGQGIVPEVLFKRRIEFHFIARAVHFHISGTQFLLQLAGNGETKEITIYNTPGE